MNGNRAWLTLMLVSALFFMITGATFASLGLALPAMVTDLEDELGRGRHGLQSCWGCSAASPARFPPS